MLMATDKKQLPRINAAAHWIFKTDPCHPWPFLGFILGFAAHWIF